MYVPVQVGVSHLLQVRDRLPQLKAIVQYLPGEVDPEQRDQGVLSWEEFMDIGKVKGETRCSP